MVSEQRKTEELLRTGFSVLVAQKMKEGRGSRENFPLFPFFYTPSLLFYSPHSSRGLLDKLQTALLIFFGLLGFKYLTEVFQDNLQILESVAKRLQTKVPDAGGWKQVAHKYGMAEETRDSLEGSQERGESVIGYLKTAHPQLTVYEFCKYLKDIKRNDIIIALSDHFFSVAN